MDFDVDPRAPLPDGLSDGIRRADAASRDGYLRNDPRGPAIAGRIYDAYLNDAVRDLTIPDVPPGHPDHGKDPLLLKKLYLAESEIALLTVERSMSFHPSGRLWYYGVGRVESDGGGEADAYIAADLITTHNHPLLQGRRTSTFSPADVSVMDRHHADGVYLQEFRMVDGRYLGSMQRSRLPRRTDLRLGRRMLQLHPRYRDYSEAERERLHEMLVALAPRAGIVYRRVPR
jgi:hypothetical protein